MGVPSFYRWLVEKYPNIVTPAVEEEDCHAGGGAAVYFDNLYLDMNGIIHPCFHPEDQTACPPPATFDDVFRSMFDYMDLLLRIVRPRRLLYLAVDGVAPRAKMNQQRARRFKSAKAAKEAELEENLMRERFRAQGKEVLPRDDAPREVSDPNIITPGTEFMEKLSAALEYYVRARLSSDPRWKDVKDADLIMLALASHEVHFSILREDVLRQNQQPYICVPVTDKSSTVQELPKVKCRGWFPRVTDSRSKGKLPKKPYQFLNIWVLREYLELEMTMPGCKHDIERLIDDFIFISFLMGNDFIPHIPSLEIHEYAVDLLIDMYKTTFNKMGGYIVDTDKIKDKHAAYVKISRLEKFLQELASHEEKIFLKRFELRDKLLHKIQRQAAGDEWNEINCDVVEESAYGLEQESISACTDVAENTLELRRNLNDNLRSKQDLFKNGSSKHDRVSDLVLPIGKTFLLRANFDMYTTDKTRIAWMEIPVLQGEVGAETSNEIGKLQTEMVQKYLEGLCWVLRYYFSDVPSWSWYYPFYYAPFTSDLKRLSQFKISFTVDKPLLPSCALPKCYSKLMCCEESTIQMFYPSDLEIDTHGNVSCGKCESAAFSHQNSRERSCTFVPISEKKLLISTRSAVFFNPEAVKPVSRLLDNVIVPDKVGCRGKNTSTGLLCEVVAKFHHVVVSVEKLL
ncbi:5'-3' exoribonuclease 2 [Hordeum vulgare]|nr:5'-3' exoribonuclease 2 [Hordeum vulgare]